MATDRVNSDFSSTAVWHLAGTLPHVLLWIALSSTVTLYNKWILVYFGTHG